MHRFLDDDIIDADGTVQKLGVGIDKEPIIFHGCLSFTLQHHKHTSKVTGRFLMPTKTNAGCSACSRNAASFLITQCSVPLSCVVLGLGRRATETAGARQTRGDIGSEQEGFQPPVSFFLSI